MRAARRRFCRVSCRVRVCGSPPRCCCGRHQTSAGHRSTASRCWRVDCRIAVSGTKEGRQDTLFPSLCFAHLFRLWVSPMSATGRRPAFRCFLGFPPGLSEKGVRRCAPDPPSSTRHVDLVVLCQAWRCVLRAGGGVVGGKQVRQAGEFTGSERCRWCWHGWWSGREQWGGVSAVNVVLGVLVVGYFGAAVVSLSGPWLSCLPSSLCPGPSRSASSLALLIRRLLTPAVAYQSRPPIPSAPLGGAREDPSARPWRAQGGATFGGFSPL